MEGGEETNIQKHEQSKGLTLNFKIHGNVRKEIPQEVTNTVKDVFDYMKYQGEPPQRIVIWEDGLKLPSGEPIAGAYGFDKQGEPGFIKIDVKLAQKQFKTTDIPLPAEVAVAIVAAHEAVEHVNFMRGKPVLISNSIVSTEVHRNSKTEQEANRTAREIIRRRYGRVVYFGDELTPKNKLLGLVNTISSRLRQKQT